MPVPDQKKVQTMINVVAEQAAIIRAAVDTMVLVRATFNVVNPDTTGTPLAGNEVAVSNAINTLDTAIFGPVWDGMIAAHIPSHRNVAMVEDGYDPEVT